MGNKSPIYTNLRAFGGGAFACHNVDTQAVSSDRNPAWLCWRCNRLQRKTAIVYKLIALNHITVTQDIKCKQTPLYFIPKKFASE